MKSKSIILGVMAFLSFIQEGKSSIFNKLEMSQTLFKTASKAKQYLPHGQYVLPKESVYRNVDNVMRDDINLHVTMEHWPAHTSYLTKGFTHVQGPVQLFTLESKKQPVTGLKQNHWNGYDYFFRTFPQHERKQLHMFVLLEDDLSKCLAEGAGYLNFIVSVGHNNAEMAQLRKVYKSWAQKWQELYKEKHAQDANAPWCVFRLNCKPNGDAMERYLSFQAERYNEERKPSWVAAQTELLLEAGMHKVILTDYTGEMKTHELVNIFQAFKEKDLTPHSGFQARGKNAVLHAILASAFGFSVIDLVSFNYAKGVSQEMMPLASDFLAVQKLLGSEISDQEISNMREFEKKSPVLQLLDLKGLPIVASKVFESSPSVLPPRNFFRGIASGVAPRASIGKPLKSEKRDPRAFIQSKYDVGC